MVVLRTDFIKCVVVGDDAVGKTSMLVSYATNRYPTQHVAAVFDNYGAMLSMSGRYYHLQLIDTLEEETCLEDRTSIYPGTDVFVICFSVVRPESFKNVEEKWMPEIRKQMGEIPVILIGTQTDLRQDSLIVQMLKNACLQPVTHAQGHALARRLGAACYIECSPVIETRLKRIINKALISVFRPRGETMDTSCTIL